MNSPDGSADGYDDAEWVAGVAARQPEALQQLYDGYSPAACALAFRLLGNAARAEECVQAAFLELGRQPQPGEPAHEECPAWLLTTPHAGPARLGRKRS
jgi:DNA-directed RNA polymerase specialized sigma24 family protein